MKKLILFLLIMLSTLGFSQGIRILQGGVDVTGKTLVEKIASNTELTSGFTLYNSTNDVRHFLVKRILNHRLDPDYKLYLAIDQIMYVPSSDSIYTIPFPVEIKPHAYFSPDGTNFGLTPALTIGNNCSDLKISYILSDTLLLDSSIVNVQYTCTTGIKKTEGEITSHAYPNPSSQLVTIDYALNSYSKNATLLLYNTWGKVVREIGIDKKEGKLLVPVENIPDGLYFYSIVSEGKFFYTGKITVLNK